VVEVVGGAEESGGRGGRRGGFGAGEAMAVTGGRRRAGMGFGGFRGGAVVVEADPVPAAAATPWGPPAMGV